MIQSSPPFEAILARPQQWRRLGISALAWLAIYAGVLLAVAGIAVQARKAPKRPRRELTVTLFDAPRLSSERELGQAGGARAASAGGNDSIGRLVKVADPRLARPSPRTKPSVQAEPKARTSDQPRESPHAGKDPLPMSPRAAEHESTASSAPAVVEASTSLTGSRDLGAAGAAGGMGGAGKGEGSGKGGSGAGAGAGSQLGVVSGDTRVLPFMDGMTRPELLSKVDPQYTREARDANVGGLILTKCVITTTGSLSRCRIVKGLPLMDQAVLSALARWRYSPVLYQGKPATVEYLIPVRLVPP